jgi:hypothetical protein
MVTYLGGSILITIFALGGSIVSYNLQKNKSRYVHLLIGTILYLDFLKETW